MFALLLSGFFLVLTVLIVYDSLRWGISPMPTSPYIRRLLIEHLPAEFDGHISDLGSGWGTLLWGLAKRFPQKEIVGYEAAWVPYYVSKLLAWMFGYRHIHIYRMDFFQASFNDQGLMICYLYPAAMQRLKTKIEQEVATPLWIVSHTFAIPNWQPVRVITCQDLYRTKIYIYRYTRST